MNLKRWIYIYVYIWPVDLSGLVCAETTVVTELCLLLRATPALKKQVVVREGQPGLEMFMISSGTVSLLNISRCHGSAISESNGIYHTRY